LAVSCMSPAQTAGVQGTTVVLMGLKTDAGGTPGG